VVKAGEETELLVGLKNDGNSIRLDSIHHCIFKLSSFFNFFVVNLSLSSIHISSLSLCYVLFVILLNYCLVFIYPADFIYFVD
jgi:hypothetical protein